MQEKESTSIQKNKKLRIDFAEFILNLINDKML